MPVYAGKLLRIDLTHKTWREEPIADEAVRKWLLGSGLAAKIYYDEMDPALDPLDPASPLIVMNGVLAGTFAPTGCRSSWCGRSPLTGIWNEANLAHYWGARAARGGLRRADHHRPGRVAHLSVDQRGDRRHRVPRRRSPVGLRLVRGRATHCWPRPIRKARSPASARRASG